LQQRNSQLVPSFQESTTYGIQVRCGLAMAPEEDQRFLSHYIIPFAFVPLHLLYSSTFIQSRDTVFFQACNAALRDKDSICTY